MRLCLALMFLTIAAPASAQDAEEPTPEAAIDPTPEPDPAATADPDLTPDPTPSPQPHPDAELLLRIEAGRLARIQGDLERALVDFQAAYELAPSGDHLLDVADTLGALRRDGELRAAYRAFLALDPEHARAAEVRARLAVLDAATPLPAPPPEEEAEDEEYEEEEEHDIFDEPWFWAIVAIAAGGALFAILYATEQGGVEDPLPGDDGFVIGTIVEFP